MTVQTLLSRLDRVRQTGRGQWVARCPAREDRTPSLSIRELEDGRVLLHDFGGSSAEEVLAAVGLTFSDLFPERLVPGIKRERLPFSYADALRCISFEALLTAVAAANIAQGLRLTDADRDRLWLAANRINHALDVCGCR